MAKKPTKITRREYKTNKEAPNKAELLRTILGKNPNKSFASVKEMFEKKGLTLASAQFYSIRRLAQDGTLTGGQVKTAKPSVVKTGKVACSMAPQTAAELYDDPALSLDASTQPPNVERTLQARRLLRQAYLEAWQLVGQNYDLVDVIVDDIQENHRVS